MLLDMSNEKYYVTVNGMVCWYSDLAITLNGLPYTEFPGLAFAADTEGGWMDFYLKNSEGEIVFDKDGKPQVERRHGVVKFRPLVL